MKNTLKKLGEAELEIMQVVWNSGNPVTSNYILKELQERRNWQLSTLMTSLARLVDKGFISCDRSTGRNLYTSIISENEYKAGASKHFLEKLYNNSIQNMITALYSNKKYIFIHFGNFSIYWIDCNWIDFSDTIFKQKVCRKMEIPDLDFSCVTAAYSF